MLKVFPIRLAPSVLTKFFICPVLFLTVFFLTGNSQVKVVGYITNDQVYSIDYDKITHLNIAFENPNGSGQLSYSPSNNTYIQNAHAKGVKVLVSIAGGGASHNKDMQNLYFKLINNDNRAAFVENISNYIDEHNFDGIDVDLEGPAINSDYGAFISALSNILKPKGKLMTCALSHVNGASNVPDEAMHLFDFINIMAYDATGPWKPDVPGQHSSFDFAVESLNYWIGRNLPKEKAILGVPFYGYGFGSDFNEGISFAQITQRFPGAEQNDIVGNTIYYNGIPTIKKKTQHVIDNSYGGIMIWQLAHDAGGTLSLLRTIHNTIHNITNAEYNLHAATELFPNPVDSIINLKPFGIHYKKVSVIDETGRECVEVKQQEDSLDVSSLPPGLYFLRLSDDRQMMVKKFKKQ